MLSKFPSLFILLITFLSFPAMAAKTTDPFHWPDNKTGAIVLSYDDGLNSQLDYAIPALNKYRFKGTFFINAASLQLIERIDDWREAAKQGHELANHTIYHPCVRGAGREWVKPWLDLAKYTKEQFLDEVRVNNVFLKALDGNSRRTFAYTCGDTEAGGESIIKDLAAHVSAARGVSNFDLAPPSSIDLYNVHSWMAGEHDKASAMIAYAKKAMAEGTVAVITFHGVGGDHIAVSAERHEKLLKFLDQNREKIWVTTFQQATDYLRRWQ